jgi:hypothetical protein
MFRVKGGGKAQRERRSDGFEQVLREYTLH